MARRELSVADAVNGRRRALASGPSQGVALTGRPGLAVRRLRRSVMVLRTALVAAACPQRTAVWVAEGSTTRRLEFRLSDERGGSRAVNVGGVRVDRCGREPTGDDAEWLVGGTRGTMPTRGLIYGEAPPGWETSRGPRPLAPGCYQVTTSGTGRATFDVSSDGTVRERPAR